MNDNLHKLGIEASELAVKAIVEDGIQPHHAVQELLQAVISVAMTFAKGIEGRKHIPISLSEDIKAMAEASLANVLSDPVRMAMVEENDATIKQLVTDEPSETAH
jgi:hypothetical protein